MLIASSLPKDIIFQWRLCNERSCVACCRRPYNDQRSGLACFAQLVSRRQDASTLQKFPQYGCFPRWPEDGQGFIHPDDVPSAIRCIPSERVLRRDRFDDVYYHYRYGQIRFRLRPCLWLQIDTDGIDIGDTVETIGAGMERELFVAVVWGMYYVRRKGCILYRLRRTDSVVPRLYPAHQLRLLTDKSTVREGEIEHPIPRWTGERDTISDIEL